MNRRDFLKSCLAAGVGMGIGAWPNLFGGRGAGKALAVEGPGNPDIVAVRNGEPEAMFDRGIAAMGGMGRFVKRGQKVAIKPNISWDSKPEYAGCTNPALVNRIVRHCLEAGAARVVVFDHTIEHWRRCWDSSQIAAAVKEAGGVMAPGETERYYAERQVQGRALTRARVHEAMLEADVLISVPILKHHGGAGMTGSIKNFMGAVWDRRTYHATDLQQCIADFLTVRKPDLSVVDAYRVMLKNGPRSGSLADVSLMKMQVLSTDIVAADASGARLLGRNPEDFWHIRYAQELGLGVMDPEKLNVRRISL